MTDQQPTTTSTDVSKHFDGDRLNKMFKLAKQFHEAKCFSSSVQNPQQALVMIQTGFEMGMPPMESMQSLYILRGKVTIFGSAMVKRLKQKGWTLIYSDESEKNDKCTVTIKKGKESYSETAYKTDVKTEGAYKFAPKNKLRYHAIAQLIKFSVPEVLDAGVMYLKEEIEDLPKENFINAEIVETEAKSAEDIKKDFEGKDAVMSDPIKTKAEVLAESRKTKDVVNAETGEITEENVESSVKEAFGGGTKEKKVPEKVDTSECEALLNRMHVTPEQRKATLDMIKTPADNAKMIETLKGKIEPERVDPPKCTAEQKKEIAAMIKKKKVSAKIYQEILALAFSYAKTDKGIPSYAELTEEDVDMFLYRVGKVKK